MATTGDSIISDVQAQLLAFVPTIAGAFGAVVVAALGITLAIWLVPKVVSLFKRSAK